MAYVFFSFDVFSLDWSGLIQAPQYNFPMKGDSTIERLKEESML